jgi:signal transduction histidine kinase
MRLLGDERNVPVTVATNGTVLVEGDPLRMRELVTILIDNSIKYTKEGGLIIISSEQEGNFVKVVVSDNGIGISEKDLPHVFERFYRVDRSRSRELGDGSWAFHSQTFGIGPRRKCRSRASSGKVLNSSSLCPKK